jgi:[histone H3]-lysine36 N-dimethyltransferase SETMAR
MEISEIRILMKYEFHRGATTRQAVGNINSVYPTQAVTQTTVAHWFKRFRSGDFDLSNQPRGRPEIKVDNDALKADVEADSSQSALELASKFGVAKSTILIHLKQINKVKKLDKWVPHELKDEHKQQRLDACLSLLSRNKADPFLHRIVTCDEKWIMYDNQKRSSQWLDPDEPPKHCPKRKVHQKKLMVTVWWSSYGVIHYDFMVPGTSITSDVYCSQLDDMMEKLAIKQPKMFNRLTPILLHDNARPHSAKNTVAKLQQLGLETLRHPPYSPDLAPTDYHFFQSLDNFLSGKNFTSSGAVKTAFQEFIDSRESVFYTKGLNVLPLKWQQCVDNMGGYFD